MGKKRQNKKFILFIEDGTLGIPSKIWKLHLFAIRTWYCCVEDLLGDWNLVEIYASKLSMPFLHLPLCIWKLNFCMSVGYWLFSWTGTSACNLHVGLSYPHTQTWTWESMCLCCSMCSGVPTSFEPGPQSVPQPKLSVWLWMLITVTLCIIKMSLLYHKHSS